MTMLGNVRLYEIKGLCTLYEHHEVIVSVHTASYTEAISKGLALLAEVLQCDEDDVRIISVRTVLV